MSGHTARVRAGNDRASLYAEITDKIIAELEAGRIPWVQPWGTAAIKAPLAMPRSASTLRGYSGINVLILWGAVIEHGFPDTAGSLFARRSGLAATSGRANGERPSSMPIASLRTTNVGAPRRPAKSRAPSRFSSAFPSSTRTNAMA
jgi:antirestriction protein ArdC